MSKTKQKINNIFLLLNGKYAKPLEKPTKKDIVIAVDGGVKHYKKLGKKPSFFVGDFDSFPKKYEKLLKKTQTKQTKKNKQKIFIYPTNKDFTDLELALNLVNKRFNYKKLIFIGAFGGELDQEYANILILKNQTKPIFICGDKKNLVFLPAQQKLQLKQTKAQKFSILGFTNLKGVFYKNAFYKDRQAINIKAFSSQGTRNKTTAKKTSIVWNKGQGLVFSAKKSEIKLKK